jgi:fructose-1,6-bisphosphatase-3
VSISLSTLSQIPPAVTIFGLILGEKMGGQPADEALLQILSRQYPTVSAAALELASCRAQLLLAAPAVHVIADIHGDAPKLRHIIHTASGRLRPLIDRLFTSRLVERERQELLAVLYYPQEQMQKLRDWFAQPRRRKQWVSAMLRRQFEMVREMAGQRRLADVIGLIDPAHRDLFTELLAEPLVRWESAYADELLSALADTDQDLTAVRAASHLIQKLAFGELIAVGNLGDGGLRIDTVIDYLCDQPNTFIVWGNQDFQWMGAALGHEALIASVLRNSVRQGHLEQLEAGYGISLEPLEKLARDSYETDPCKEFAVGGKNLRDPRLLRRMHKAAAVLQYKLDSQLAGRNPHWKVQVQSPGPGIDPSKLSPPEQDCLSQLRESFLASRRLWEQMSWITDHGHLWLRRDPLLILHGGVPVAQQVDGKDLSGRKLLNALETVIRRAFRAGSDAAAGDTDWFWYLSSASRSISKGIAKDFDMPEDTLVVTAQSSVKPNSGTIALDSNHSLIMDASGINLAEQPGFQSVELVITKGIDAAPILTSIRKFEPSRTTGQTETGRQLQSRIDLLQHLIQAYRNGKFSEAK